MKYQASSVNEYLQVIPEERRDALQKLRQVILENIPKGFEEIMNYGMPGLVVPHSIYPNGYHCDTSKPLPFVNYASQKNFIGLYHMGLYANKDLLDWFVTEYSKHCKTKLDMGKSCIRFKKPENIPFVLIAELMTKMTVTDWVDMYEGALKR